MRNHDLYTKFTSGDEMECLRCIEEVLKTENTNRTYPLHLKGLVLRKQGKLEEALACFHEVISIDSNDIPSLKQVTLKIDCLSIQCRPLIEVAKTHMLLGNYRQSLRVYDDLDRGCHLDSECLRHMATSYIMLDKPAKGLECFERAKESHPKEELYLSIFREQLKWKDNSDALQTVSEAIEKVGPTAQLLSNHAFILKTLDQNAALQAFSDSLRLDPLNEAAVLSFGCMMQAEENIDFAKKEYCRLLAMLDSSNAWNNVAMCFYSQKKYAQAVSSLRQALILEPLDWRLHYNLGCCYLQLRQDLDAVVHLQSAINLNRKHPSSWNLLGLALCRLEDYSNAEQTLKNAIKLEENPTTHLHMAIMYYNCGDKTKAKEHLTHYNKRLSHYEATQSSKALQLEELLKGS